MQANCPQCQNRIVVDDAKVPDRPFNVKCPKCQTVVRFPGKGAAAAPAPPAAAKPPAAAPSPAPAGDDDSAEAAAALMAAKMRMEKGDARRALVALADANLAGAMALCLSRLGYGVETVDDPAQAGRLLEQGLFEFVVTSRTAGTEGHESLYQRIGRMPPPARRRLFLILVGDEFRTGDGTQAWAVVADMVVKSADVPRSEPLIRATLAERDRLYKAYEEATRHAEAAKGY